MNSADLIQGSEAWLAARVGQFGASELGALMAKGAGKTRASLIHRKVCERISGKAQGWGGNANTQAGHEQEPLGRRAYEERTGAFVVSVGLITHPTMPYTHASPDGLVDEEGGLELKSHVKFETHYDAIDSDRIVASHIYQCQWGMACTGRQWWDYGHFCIEAPEYSRLYLFPRVARDNAIIATLTIALQDAEQEVQKLVANFQARFDRNGALGPVGARGPVAA